MEKADFDQKLALLEGPLSFSLRTEIHWTELGSHLVCEEQSEMVFVLTVTAGSLAH